MQNFTVFLLKGTDCNFTSAAILLSVAVEGKYLQLAVRFVVVHGERDDAEDEAGVDDV